MLLEIQFLLQGIAVATPGILSNSSRFGTPNSLKIILLLLEPGLSF